MGTGLGTGHPSWRINSIKSDIYAAQLAEREGLSGNFIRSPYISEKSAIYGGVTGYLVDYFMDYRTS